MILSAGGMNPHTQTIQTTASSTSVVMWRLRADGSLLFFVCRRGVSVCDSRSCRQLLKPFFVGFAVSWLFLRAMLFSCTPQGASSSFNRSSLSVLPVIRRGKALEALHEVTVASCDDGRASCMHKIQQVGDVVFRQQNSPNHLFLLYKMVNIGSSIASYTHRTGAAWVERCMIVGKASVLEIETSRT